ncbi:MAG TPA: DUF3027 domain-containing protein, partial [Agromyces sp.]
MPERSDTTHDAAVEPDESTDAAEPVESTDAAAATMVADDVLLASVDLARRALLEVTPAETVGSVVGHLVEGEHVLTLLFASDLSGYPGWHWSVTITRVDEGDPTVLETELMPGESALLAPDWIPWSERLADYRAAQEAAAAAAAAAGEEAGEGAADEGDESDADVDDDELDEDEDEDDFDDDAELDAAFGNDAGDDEFDGIDIDALDDSDSDDDDDQDDDEEDDSADDADEDS